MKLTNMESNERAELIECIVEGMRKELDVDGYISNFIKKYDGDFSAEKNELSSIKQEVLSEMTLPQKIEAMAEEMLAGILSQDNFYKIFETTRDEFSETQEVKEIIISVLEKFYSIEETK